MDTEALRTFIAVAETKNFTRAAGQCYVAQSTVTNRIKELENEIQTDLFKRSKRNVELTYAGEQFYEYAKKMIDMTDTSISKISAQKNYENRLRIGAADSIYEAYLSSRLVKYRQAHPEDALWVSIGVSTKLIDQLAEGIYDVIFSYLPSTNKKYICNVFKKDEMVLVTDTKNTMYKDGIKREELLTVNYIMCNFALRDVGQFIRGIFPKYHAFSLEIDDCSKVIPYLMGQETYTFIPKEMAKRFLNDGTLREIKLLDICTPIIQSYIIGNKTKQELWKDIFLSDMNC